MKALVFICFALIFINLSSAIKLNPLKFDKEICFIHSYPRGTPQQSRYLDCPKNYFYDMGNCFEDYCPDHDYYSQSGMFSKPCPKGFKSVNGLLCERSPYLDVRTPYYKEIAECEKDHEKCGIVDKSISGNIRPYCNATRLDTVNFCIPEYHRYRVMSALGCLNGLELASDKLCYPPCSPGFEGLGDVCIEPCPKSSPLRCGKVCTNGTSCEDGKIQGIQAAIYAIEEIAIKASIDIETGNMMCWN